MGPRGSFALLLTIGLLAPVGCEKATGPDLSNPKAAAITFARALETGDLATARLASNASGYESDLLEAMAESSSGMGRLAASAQARLGTDAQRIVQQHASIGMIRMLADADVDMKGDRATVTSKQGGPIQLQKLDGEWRVDIGALSKGQDVTQLVHFLRAAGLAARQVADDLDAGRLTDAAAVQEAIPRRVMANLPPRVRSLLLPRRAIAPATTMGS